MGLPKMGTPENFVHRHRQKHPKRYDMCVLKMKEKDVTNVFDHLENDKETRSDRDSKEKIS